MLFANAAILSGCGHYRYLLRRVWEPELPRALLIMLNPSTADAEKDDATIRSCRRLLSSLGYGGFEVVNLFGLRATDPDELLRDPDPVGPDNDVAIRAAIDRCDTPIAAWGAHKAATSGRVGEVVGMVGCSRPALMCFGRTKAGAPKHPLYLKTGTPLVTLQGATQ